MDFSFQKIGRTSYHYGNSPLKIEIVINRKYSPKSVAQETMTRFLQDSHLSFIKIKKIKFAPHIQTIQEHQISITGSNILMQWFNQRSSVC